MEFIENLIDKVPMEGVKLVDWDSVRNSFLFHMTDGQIFILKIDTEK